MIRHFESIDKRRIKPNGFSAVRDMGFVFNDPDFYKFTCVGEDSNVHAIICFRRYWKNNFFAFFLISDGAPRSCFRELRDFIYQAVEDLRADRVQTESVACKTLKKWHAFLGFTWEGCREKMIYDKDYDMWAINRGRDY